MTAGSAGQVTYVRVKRHVETKYFLQRFV